MKIVLIGTVEIGLTILESVYETNGEVEAVFTLPLESKMKPSGFIDFGPLVEERGTQLIRTSNVNTEDNIVLIRDISPDLVIVGGWQRLICEEIINIPRLGAVGFHSSMLPYYRGRAPVNWAIIMGERETGISMFYLTPDTDDGDIIGQKSFPILFNDDCRTVYEKAAWAGADLIRTYLPKIKDGTVQRIHNEARNFPTYPKRTPADGLIDYNRSSLDIYNFVRALTRPYPGAFFFDESGKKVIVWKTGIVFDESRLSDNDIVMETKDYKMVLLDYEIEG
jgi:methionyl-tRNA formyltransferase